MARYILILLILFISIIRYNKHMKKGKHANFLLLSTLIQLIPLSGIICKLGSIHASFNVMPGATDSFFAIDALWIVTILIVIFHIKPLHPSLKTKPKQNYKFFLILTIIEIISILNPINSLPYAGLPTFLRITQLFIFLHIISKYLSYQSALKGLYDGFKWAVGLQFIITTLFPVLHISYVSQLFRPEIASWAFRRDMASALGTFMHPGALALFSCMSAIFFFACYLNKYKNKDAIVRLMMCIYIILFTYSRTSYLTIIGTLLFIYILCKNRKGIRTSSIIYFCIGTATIVILFLTTPLTDLFFKSDVDTQIENRELHFLLALASFKDSPIFGIGLNNHVNYLHNILNTNNIGHVIEFFITNPIHNSHLIILAETGLIGFSLWCYYFISRIFMGFKYCIGTNPSINIINLSFSGILLVYILYGMTGWSCFHREIYPFLIVVGFFTLKK